MENKTEPFQGKVNSEEPLKYDKKRDMFYRGTPLSDFPTAEAEIESKKQRAFISQLELQGHTCMFIVDSPITKESKVAWCENVITCKNKEETMEERDDKVQEKYDILKKEGHVCLDMGQDIYPRRLRWCKNTPCSKIMN